MMRSPLSTVALPFTLQTSTLLPKSAFGSLLLLVFCVSAAPAEAAVVSYDFSPTTVGSPLTATAAADNSPSSPGNQDGWYKDANNGGFVFTVANGTGIYSSSKVAQGSALGANSGGRALKNFGTSFFDGNTGAFEMNFQLNVNGSASMYLGGNTATTALASYTIHTDKMSPLMGVTAFGDGSFNFSLGVLSGVETRTSYTQNVTGLPISNYYGLRIAMDSSTNSGNGSGSVSYRNVTSGGSWIALSGLQNLNLGLTWAEAGFGFNTWNQVGLLANNTAAVAQFSAVPEPMSTTLLLGGSAFFLLRIVRRRRRSG